MNARLRHQGPPDTLHRQRRCHTESICLDIYHNFGDLAEREEEDAAYRIRTLKAGATLILAPHAGGIEPGTSELAEAIAGNDHSLYLFEGVKTHGNGELHITSTRFDEPTCVVMLARADRVLAIHGEARGEAAVIIGGLDAGGITQISAALATAAFHVVASDKPHLEGRAQSNVCNRGRSRAGIQLEITDGLRRSFFRALTPRDERQHRTTAFDRFVTAVRLGLAG
jgi:phage replication-related protein YjqB (UPF0714/DUF867 family)